MKTQQLYRNAVLFLITISIGIVLLMAEINYKAAIQASCNSEGSDIAIEETMLKYGFNIDANEIIQPNMIEKIKALLNK